MSVQPPSVVEECRSIGPRLSRALGALEVRAGVAPSELAVRLRQDLSVLPVSVRSIRIGVNDDVLETVPTDRPLAPGDLVKVGVDVRGAATYASQAWTYPVFPLSLADRALILAGQGALAMAAALARAGNRVGDVSAAIKERVEGAGFSCVRDYTGCAIGAEIMSPPAIPCFGKPGRGARLVVGMVLHLHVIANAGRPELVDGPGGVVTADGSRSVLFTRTVHLGADATEDLTVPVVLRWDG